MPTSRIRTKKGRTPQKSHADVKRINDSYHKKVDELMELSLGELQELEVTKKLKGTYLVALNTAIEHKTAINKQIEKNKNESTEEHNTPVEAIQA
jgi:hypothetical protein